MRDDHMELRQRTIAREITCTGIGLHSGKKAWLNIKPGLPDSGITFERIDTAETYRIKASFDNVINTNMATTIGMNGYSVSTIEHLTAAFFGMGIDNAIVQIRGEEVPIMDGSSAPFVYLLHDAGITIQDRFKRFLIVKKQVKVADGNRFVHLYPSDELRISYKIDFNHPLIKDQCYEITFSKSKFIKEICSARTFGFLRDVQTLWDNGLAKGGSLKNAVVVDESSILNEDGLRYKNEFVRHKILDFIGDLAILGHTVIGHFVVERSGHSLNQMLLRKFMAHESSWEELQFKTEEDYGNKQLKIPSFGMLDFAPA
jgi:UDP-3-O-[3-hydroxymyristoyl] N-acetylglucosamine deacetylase